MWWTEQGAGLIGGLGGATIGIVGGGLGTAMGLLIPRGKARRAVLGTLIGAIVVGVCLFTLGVVAVLSGQPYHVFYPLLLGGGLLACLMTALLPVAVMQYELAAARIADGFVPGAEAVSGIQMERSPGMLRAIVEMWGPDGWMRRRVRPVQWGLLIAGALATLGGLVALATGQAFEVWFAALMVGFEPLVAGFTLVILTASMVGAANRVQVQLEQQRLDAESLRRE